MLLIVCLIPSNTLAHGTRLSTTVPAKHLVNITIYGGGSVTVDGTRRFSSGTVQVNRQTTPTVIVKEKYGYQLASLTYNGASIIDELTDASWSMPTVCNDCEIVAVFIRDEKIDLTYQISDMQALFEYLSLRVIPPKDLNYYEVTGDGYINILDYQAMYEIIKASQK